MEFARETPLIVVNPSPDQEEWNADFVSGSGTGIQVRLPEKVPAAVLALLNESERLDAMRTQAEKVGRPRAALDISEFILADLGHN